MKLEIELVPRTAWFKNIRSEVPITEWDRLRASCYKQAGYCCEICGGKGPKWPVECHELWKYDDANHVQTLTGLIALCPSCHEVKHIGLAQVRGKFNRAKLHLQSINGWGSVMARDYIASAFNKWEARSQHDWTLDLSWLNK